MERDCGEDFVFLLFSLVRYGRGVFLVYAISRRLASSMHQQEMVCLALHYQVSRCHFKLFFPRCNCCTRNKDYIYCLTRYLICRHLSHILSVNKSSPHATLPFSVISPVIIFCRCISSFPGGNNNILKRTLGLFKTFFFVFTTM